MTSTDLDLAYLCCPYDSMLYKNLWRIPCHTITQSKGSNQRFVSCSSLLSGLFYVLRFEMWLFVLLILVKCGIVVHLNLSSFQTNTEHIINKYNPQLEKGTNIKQQTPCKQHISLTKKQHIVYKYNNRSFLENIIHYYRHIETAK